MNNGEALAWIVTILLAIYGCAQVIRRLCLRLTRCPRCVRQYRLAVPDTGAALEPLIRCLQAQTVWEEERDRQRVLLLLPPGCTVDDPLIAVLQESPAVTPVAAQELLLMLEKNQKDK